MSENQQKVTAPAEEKLVWEGSPKWQADFGFILLSVLISLLGVFLLIWRPFAYVWAVGLALMALGALMVVGVRLKRRAQRYKLTNLIIEFEHGVFSTHIDNMELWRINDIGFHQNLFDKILGVSTIRLHTQDKSDPEMDIEGLPPGRQIYDSLKAGVHIARQARNVLGMTE
jgi:membrane protein YdbS with pleckstrin-like domain